MMLKIRYYLLGAVATMLLSFLCTCSDSNNPIPKPTPEPDPEPTEEWTTLTATPDAWDNQKRADISYQLLVYSFADSDGDGCGDFNGIKTIYSRWE